jgi:hypothetical protein
MHWRTWSGVRKTYFNYAFGAGAAIGKYIRTGDWASLHLLKNWFWVMGIRKILSGLKHHVWQKVYIGVWQLIYPWVGLWHSRKYIIDPTYRVYIGKKGQSLRTPTLNSWPPSNES